jgi:hypothetical protein
VYFLKEPSKFGAKVGKLSKEQAKKFKKIHVSCSTPFLFG